MLEAQYKLSDILEMLKLEEQEVQYYETNLSLPRKKTGKGMVYYLQEDVTRLGYIHTLKGKGFHIRAIKYMLPYIDKVIMLDEQKLNEFKNKLDIALGLCGEEAKENLRETYTKPKSNEVVKQQEEPQLELQSSTRDKSIVEEDGKVIQLRELLFSIINEAIRQNNDPLVQQINNTLVPEIDYRMRLLEQREEERFRQIDRTIREKQLGLQQAAITKETGYKKQSKFFKKNNVRI